MSQEAVADAGARAALVFESEGPDLNIPASKMRTACFINIK